MKQMILTAALTGAITPKEKNASLPTTVDEIVQSAYWCYKSGASIVHIHVRDNENKAALEYKLYEEVIHRIRGMCEILICISTSSYGVQISDEERLKLLDLDTDLATLTFGNVYRKGGTNLNSNYYIEQALSKMEQKRICPEIEIFSLEMLENCINYFADKKITPYIQLIFGADGGMGSTVEDIMLAIERIPEHWMWSAAGVGKQQLVTNMLCLLNESNGVRTGFEDNVYLTKGILAESNHQLVERLVRYIKDFSYQVASPKQAKKILCQNYKYI